MKILKSYISLFAAMLFMVNTNAQVTDTIAVGSKSKVPGPLKMNNQIERPSISYISFVIPAFMIAYGFTTLNSDGLKDINEEIKEEVWTEAPHHRTHIDNVLQFTPAIAVYALNFAGIKGKNNLLDGTIIYSISNIILNTAVFTIKDVTLVKRPDGASYNSFPSGHTAEAFASAEFLRQEYKDLSPWYGIGGYAVATATAMLRMYNNRHWLSDVVAGAGIGIASTKLAYLVYPVIKKKFFRNKNMNTMIMPYYQNKGGGISLVYNLK